jgi:rRNA maturation RNase YbeY
VLLVFDHRQSRIPLDPEELRGPLTAMLEQEQAASWDLTIVLVDDADIQRINAEFLQHDWPTDVISFSLDEPHLSDAEPDEMSSETGIDSFDRPAELASDSSPAPDSPTVAHLAPNSKSLSAPTPTPTVASGIEFPPDGFPPDPEQMAKPRRLPRGFGQSICGELVISVETAAREAPRHQWSLQAELLLYAVHGALHLCGYDDLSDDERAAMRSRERELLQVCGLCPKGLEP